MPLKQRIFITNTMRSGSSLLVNLLTVHSKILIMSDNVHFFRFMYKRYGPLCEKNLHFMLYCEKARLKYRLGIELNVEEILSKVKKRGFTYQIVYDEIMNSFLKMTNRMIWGEAPALQWREIPIFLNFFSDGKVIHLYRDPRGVISSWKKLSSLPDDVYLNAIFNWIDSINHVERYTESLSPDRYIAVKYEDIHAEPEVWAMKLCDFIGVPFEDNLIQPEKWQDILSRIGSNLVKIPRSAHEGNNIVGFSMERTKHWKNNLEDWEICLIEFLTKDKMEKLGYDFFKKSYPLSLLRKGIDILRKNPFLLQQLNVFLATGEGINKYPTDPTNPNSWGAPHNPSEWFMDSPVAKDYFEDIKKAEKTMAAKYDYPFT